MRRPFLGSLAFHAGVVAALALAGSLGSRRLPQEPAFAVEIVPGEPARAREAKAPPAEAAPLPRREAAAVNPNPPRPPEPPRAERPEPVAAAPEPPKPEPPKPEPPKPAEPARPEPPRVAEAPPAEPRPAVPPAPPPERRPEPPRPPVRTAARAEPEAPAARPAPPRPAEAPKPPAPKAEARPAPEPPAARPAKPPPEPAPKAAARKPEPERPAPAKAAAAKPPAEEPEPKRAAKAEPPARPAAAGARPPPEPRPPEDSFDTLLKSVESQRKRVEAPEARPGKGAAATAEVSAAQLGALRASAARQLEDCWRLPAGMIGADAVRAFPVNVKVNPDGTVAAVRLVAGPSGGADPAVTRAITESAQRAAWGCKLSLPPDLYSEWKDMNVNFDPQRALAG